MLYNGLCEAGGEGSIEYKQVGLEKVAEQGPHAGSKSSHVLRLSEIVKIMYGYTLSRITLENVHPGVIS